MGLLEVLVVISSIRVVVPMLLGPELVHLLGTCAKLIGAAAVITHRHCITVSIELGIVSFKTYSVLEVAERRLGPQIEGLGSYQGSCRTWVVGDLVENLGSSSWEHLYQGLESH